MANTVNNIDNKIAEYRELRARLNHDHTTAQKLGYEAEMNRVRIDLAWVKEIIEMLQEVKK